MTLAELVTIVLTLLTGAWMLGKELRGISIALSDKVSFGDCEKRQEKCPCVEQIKNIQHEIEKQHPRG